MDADAVRSRLCAPFSIKSNNTRSASISIGVLHEGQVIFTRSRGFRDVESQAPADSDTNYLLCSLSKAFTASCCGILVDERKLKWEEPIQSCISFTNAVDPVIGQRATVQDALSHNTGLAHMDLTWLGVECNCILEKKELLEVFEFLKRKILKPLEMHRTRTRRTTLPDDNFAEPHVVLDDHSLHKQKPVDTAAVNMLMGPAGAVWSCVSDLMIWAKALLDGLQGNPDTVLKQVSTIMSHKTNITSSSIGENTYGLGFARAMIPTTELGMFSLNGPQREHIIGQNSRPRLVLYHNGGMSGYLTAFYLFPETRTAVVALGNSYSLGDGPDWSAQAIVQAMFNLEPRIDFAEVSSQRAKIEYERYDRLAAEFDHFRDQERGKEGLCDVTLSDYVGKFTNRGLRMTLEVGRGTEKSLIMVVNNLVSQHHQLRNFSRDKLGFLPCSRKEFVVREFIDWFQWDQFVLSFERNKESGKVVGVRWALQVGLEPVQFHKVAEAESAE
ncbi:beta-lactamase transpeptidase [Fusarium circinatum]|uniref:Beta-lactamase transpeptidase n=1 Tax=Fusarium circinatum TaxID=48490 RepID=A0A8H5UIT5_FUSCI|nr:beta-lactamase transpeptidase [Fusarium circinatum]